MELCPGGARRKVAYEEREAWAAGALIQYLSTSFEPLLRPLQAGLYAVVPPKALRVLQWEELEVACAGRAEVDVGVLRSRTALQGYSRESPVVVHFWRLFEGWSHAQRSAYLRFVWGRSRLPAPDHWPRERGRDVPHVISRATGGVLQLPMAHTCFFHLELPPYPSFEVLQSKLELAMSETTMQVV